MGVICIYKAIITAIEDNGYQVKIRIPFFDRAENTLGSTPNYNLYTAAICTSPGINPAYKVGDVVFIEFENNDTSLPVVLGPLYRENTASTSSIEVQSLTVDVSSSLPEDTSIGLVTEANIKSLIRITDISQQGGGSSGLYIGQDEYGIYVLTDTPVPGVTFRPAAGEEF